MSDIESTEPVKTWRVLRDVSEQNNARGKQFLVRVDPPLKDYDDSAQYEFVVASSVEVMFSGYETLVFPSNEKGEVVSRVELIGMRGAEKEEVFAESGYREVSA